MSFNLTSTSQPSSCWREVEIRLCIFSALDRRSGCPNPTSAIASSEILEI
jgi:hypothetical protein